MRIQEPTEFVAFDKPVTLTQFVAFDKPVTLTHCQALRRLSSIILEAFSPIQPPLTQACPEHAQGPACGTTRVSPILTIDLDGMN